MNKAFDKIVDRIEELKEMLVQDNCIGACEPTDCVRCGIIKAEKIVQEVAEEYHGGWIPVSERLPEPTRPVLVTIKNWTNEKLFVRQGRFHINHWRTDEGILKNSAVIAWMPLPEPYKESED